MGRPRLIILVRHGESEGNCDKSVNTYTPNHRIHLTELGTKQARNAGERLVDLLEPDDNILFYTSPYKRTTQTTDGILEAVQKRGVPYKIYEEPRLREQDFGNFQGPSNEMAKVWKERAHYGHFFYRIPNGESAADVYDRIAGFNETLFRQFSTDKFPSVLVLVSHGIWCRVFLMKWFRWSYEQFEEFRNLGHCEFLIMEKGEGKDEKYNLLTPLRTWADPPDDELVIPVVERNENTKDSKSLRYRKIRTRDETSLAKQHEKDARIREAFLRAQAEQPVNKDLAPGKSASSALEEKCDLLKSELDFIDEAGAAGCQLLSEEPDYDSDDESMRKSGSAHSSASATSAEELDDMSLAKAGAPSVKQHC